MFNSPQMVERKIEKKVTLSQLASQITCWKIFTIVVD